MSDQTLREQVSSALEQSRISGSVITGVALHRAQSRNGRRYTPEAMADLMELADGAHVFLDHDGARVDGVRSMRDLIGFVESPRLEADELVRGNVHLVDSRWRDLVVSLAEEHPEGTGLSIAARGNVERRDGTQIVRSVERLVSIDLVAQPATVSGLFESLDFDSGRPRVRRDPKPITDEIVEEASYELFT